jgi:hypothetical protein
LQIANSALIAYTPCGVETDSEFAGCFGLAAANARLRNKLMSTKNPTVNVDVSNVHVPDESNFFRAARPRTATRGIFLALVVALGSSFMFFPTPARGQAADASPSAPSVTQANVKLVIGGDTVKNNSEGTLSVVGSSLQFATAKTKVEVKASSIQDISTNEDSRQDITGTAHFAAMAIPYGGGRVLSLFSHQVDVLTVEFKDADGGFHGTVFVLPQGQAAPFKKQLVSMGAKASVPLADPAAPANK